MESETGKRLFVRLRELRQKRGLTQEALAERADIKYKHYQSIEGGRKPDVRLSTLVKLAKAHGMDVWELFLPESLTPMVAELQAKYGRTHGQRGGAGSRAKSKG